MTEQVVFQNDEWTVYTDRMVHHSGYGYEIYEGLDQRHSGSKYWHWPIQILTKTWGNPRTFAEAFVALLQQKGIPVDSDLLLTFHYLGKRSAEDAVRAQVRNELSPPTSGITSFDSEKFVEIEVETRRRLGR